MLLSYLSIALGIRDERRKLEVLQGVSDGMPSELSGAA